VNAQQLVWPVVFDDAAFHDDLDHLTPLGRRTMLVARDELEQHGVPHESLRKTAGEHEGTDLTGCTKIRLPSPTHGRWGAVLRPAKIMERPTLVVIAVGERHPAETWRPSVYAIAHGRLHGSR
jgi:hypothetical protein